MKKMCMMSVGLFVVEEMMAFATSVGLFVVEEMMAFATSVVRVHW